MDLPFYDKRIDNLLRHFEQLSKDIGGFVSDIEIGGSTVPQALIGKIGLLENKVRSWAWREIPAIYRREQRGVGNILKKFGKGRRIAERPNERDLRLIISEPGFGLVPKLLRVTSEQRNLLFRVRQQLIDLRRSGDLLRATESRLRQSAASDLRGTAISIGSDIATLSAIHDRTFSQKGVYLPEGHIFKNLSSLGSSRVGSRVLRIDSYTRMILKSVVSQTVAVARRNRLLESGEALIQVKPVKSSSPTPCHLYIGRVFALTQEAAEENKVPHVLELPSGGVPFHPGCLHEEVPWVRKRSKDAFSLPPDWSLNSSFEEVRERYMRLGGDKLAEEQNPMFSGAQEREEDAWR